MPTTSQEYVEQLLDRIDTVDAHTNAVCTPNPDALGQRGRARRGGCRTAAAAARCTALPVLVKDNIDTARPAHHGGVAGAGRGSAADRDAALVQRLRDAGMVRAGQDQPVGVGQHPRRVLDLGLERRTAG